MQEVFLTAQGYKELEERLEYLKTVRRHEVSEKIKIAREFGDISENAEYDSAKDEQAMVEGEILEIENKLYVAKIIDEDSASGQVVRLGSTVTFLNVSNDTRMTYQIVGTTEADPLNARISNESPVGRMSLNKKKGAIIDVEVPTGTLRLKILDIN